MMKFFRKIRFDLMDKNKSAKYFKYAIGEVLLVMIGILLALQVNTWNEQRKNRAYFESLLDSIEEDLRNNLEHANVLFRFYHNKDRLSRLVLNEKVSRTDYLENRGLGLLLSNNRPIDLISDNLEKLVDNEEMVPEKYLELISDAKVLHTLEIELDRLYEEIRRKQGDNLAYITLNSSSGYKQDSVSREARINYFLSDEVYKNRVYLAWVSVQAKRNRISVYRATALGMLGRMKHIRNNYDAKQISQMYEELDMIPFQQFDCQDPIIEYEKNARESHLIVNLTPKAINFGAKYMDEHQPRERTLQPYQFRVIRSMYKGLEGAYNWEIEIKKEGSCVEKYVTRKNSYLIIE